MARVEQLKKMLEAEPDDVFLHFALAMEHAKAGDHRAALAHFDRVIFLDRAYHAAYFHKGSTLIGLGRVDEAQDVLRRGVEAAGRAGDAHAEEEMRGLLATTGG